MGSRPEVACAQCSFCPGPRSRRCSIRRRSWRRSPRASWRCLPARWRRRRARRSPPTAGSVLTMAGRRAGVAGGGEARRRLPGQRRAGARSAPGRDLPVRRVDRARCLALMDGEAITGLRTAAGVRAVGARAGARGRARARGRRLRRPGAGAPADAAAGARVRRRAARRARSGRRLAARRRRRARSRAPTSSALHVVVVARPVVACRAGHARHLGRLRAAGRRARPALWPRRRGCSSRRAQAFEAPPAGCAELAGLDPSVGTELGDVLLGRPRARASADEVTVYKAMGHIAEDAAAAELVYRAALSAGVGRDVDV